MQPLAVRNDKEFVTGARVHRESIGKVGEDDCNNTLEHFLKNIYICHIIQLHLD